MNVLYIGDQDLQRRMIAADYSGKIKTIQSIVNPPLMVYNTKNETTHQEFQINHKFQEKGRPYYCCWKLRKRKVEN